MSAFVQRLAQNYDFIIVDLPPVTVVSDAVAVSKILDGVIVVVRGGVSDQQMLAEALRQLEMVNVRILGFTFRDTDGAGKRHGSKYGKKYYKYYSEYMKHKQH
jgi:Mrp family chromosome partitioning ATPase